MCDLPQRHGEFKSEGRIPYGFEDWKKVIRSYSKIGTSGMAISGGEPFLNKDLYRIIKEVKKNKMVCQVTTNGWFINDESAIQLISTGIDTITISIDGASSEVHDEIRGIPGSFEKALNAIEVLNQTRRKLKSNVKINVSTVFGKSNYKEALKIKKIVKDLGADCIGFIPVHTIAPNVDKDLSLLDEVQRNEIMQIIDELIEEGRRDKFIETSEKYFNLFKSFFSNKPLPMSCLAGYTTLIVDCYGDIFPCFSFYEMKSSWGNLSEYEGLEEFWSSKGIKGFRKEIKSCRDCYWNCQVETNLLYKLI
jgi:MoaA/NifB/PqqE/SkfB family radical SAM enzyme